MEDIIKNDIYNYNIFGTSGKYEMNTWTSSHVDMVNRIRSLGLWHNLKPYIDINRLM